MIFKVTKYFPKYLGSHHRPFRFSYHRPFLLSAFKLTMEELFPVLSPLLIDPMTFHMTLAVLYLDGDEDLELARRAMHSFEAHFRALPPSAKSEELVVSGTIPLSIQFR